jgi:hypothetical protein
VGQAPLNQRKQSISITVTDIVSIHEGMAMKGLSAHN